MTNIKVESPVFGEGREIPRRYTEDGVNVSPPIAWERPSENVAEFAMICEDPDAPCDKPWVHWVIHGIPGSVHRLEEGMPRDAVLSSPAGAHQGINSWGSGNIGYRGPAPPRRHGLHHYHFKLYALDESLNLASGISKETLLTAMQGHVIGTGELIGTYER